MKIFSTEDMTYKDVIKCTQTENNNKKRWKFQGKQIEVLEQCGINTTGMKQAQKQVQQVK